MYNMQTSMRLGGGRVDERKDYGRSPQRQRCFSFPLHFIYGWKANERHNYNRMSICSTNIVWLHDFKYASFWQLFKQFVVRDCGFIFHSRICGMGRQSNHRQSLQYKRYGASRNIRLTKNEVIA